MPDKKFTNYRLYYNFLNSLAKDLTRYYYKKLNKPFKVINKSRGKNFDPVTKADRAFEKFIRSKIKKKFPKLLIIADGTQFCGTKLFDFDNSAIDILISSGYKWLFSGYGNGFILIKKNFIKDFINKNYNTNIEEFLYGTFEPGNLDTLSFGSLLFSINKISDFGIDKIENRINVLADYAKEKFIDYNLLDYQVKNRVKHSNIFNLKGDDSLYQQLIKNQIICSRRGSGIRVSFNFYNNEKQIDSLLKFFK